MKTLPHWKGQRGEEVSSREVQKGEAECCQGFSDRQYKNKNRRQLLQKQDGLRSRVDIEVDSRAGTASVQCGGHSREIWTAGRFVHIRR